MISTVSILIRCILCGLLAILIPIIPQQAARKKAGLTFNNWQTIFILSALLVLGEYYLYKFIPIPNVPQFYICIDTVVVYVLCKLINKMALTSDIAKKHIQVVTQSFFINKLSTILLIYIVLITTQTTQIMSLEFRENVEMHLWLFEMPISVDAYIQNIVISNLNTQYSMGHLVTIVLIHVLVCSTIMWCCNHFDDMPLLYKLCVFSTLILVVTSYDKFLYGLTTLTNMAMCAILFVCAMICWWWTQEHRSKKRLSVHSAQKILHIF